MTVRGLRGNQRAHTKKGDSVRNCSGSGWPNETGRWPICLKNCQGGDVSCCARKNAKSVVLSIFCRFLRIATADRRRFAYRLNAFRLNGFCQSEKRLKNFISHSSVEVSSC